MKITEFVPEMWLSDVEPIEAFPSTPSIRVELAKRCLLFIRDIAGRAISSGNPADIGYALQEISQTLLYRCSAVERFLGSKGVMQPDGKYRGDVKRNSFRKYEKTTGSAAAMKPAPIKDDDEWRKTLTATIQAGQCLTIFDNIDHVLSSPSLALALTTSTWTDRILGFSEIVTLPQRTVFIGTGNNITLGGDLPRRCYRIRLNAQCPEPWRNRQFRHPDLGAWVQVNCGRLFSCGPHSGAGMVPCRLPEADLFSGWFV